MMAKVPGWTNAVRRVTRRRKVVMIREPGRTRLFCVCFQVEQMIRAWSAMPIPSRGRGATAIV